MKTILLDGPGKNALSTAVMSATLSAVRDAGSEAILLTGAGDSFSAGLNLKELVTFDPPALERFLRLFDALIVALLNHPRPTVACINGHAVAGGCVLVQCCDVRISTSNRSVKIGVNEVALGLQFPPRALKLLQARAPLGGRAILEGGLYEPSQALALTLIDEISDDAHGRSSNVAQSLAALPTETYARTKRLLRASVSNSTEQDDRDFMAMFPTWERRIHELRNTMK